jgi:hypothetical protein
MNFDDLNFEREGSYNEWVAYGQSKLANLLVRGSEERGGEREGAPRGCQIPCQRVERRHT